MSDPDSELTPAQDDAVRRLLASARHTDPTPPAVVARLDETLASLASERRAALETRAPVVTLASRRRRTAATALLAAAAVVVFGVGIGQLLPSTNGGSDDSAGSGAESSSLAEDQMGAESGSAFGAESDSQADGGADAKQGDAEMRTQETAPAPTLGALEDLSGLTNDADLKAQVRALRRTATAADDDADPTCRLPGAGPGERVPVTYDGLPGALVFRAPAGSTQRVDVFLCGEREALRSLKLRAP